MCSLSNRYGVSQYSIAGNYVRIKRMAAGMMGFSWMDKDRPESASHRTMMLESFSVTLLQLSCGTGRDNVL